MAELGASTSLWLLPLRHLQTADESLSSEKYSCLAPNGSSRCGQAIWAASQQWEPAIQLTTNVWVARRRFLEEASIIPTPACRLTRYKIVEDARVMGRVSARAYSAGAVFCVFSLGISRAAGAIASGSAMRGAGIRPTSGRCARLLVKYRPLGRYTNSSPSWRSISIMRPSLT
jgi:hypothetical protein